MNEITPRPRPLITNGKTIAIKTGCGKIYITVNTDDLGVCEVFAQLGKSGGCTAGQIEAISRLVSLCLRSGVAVESITAELKGIRCPSPRIEDKVLSCADALGKAIEEVCGIQGAK
jgi:ribonucleoside-diphosphate reductase alpha chain